MSENEKLFELLAKTIEQNEAAYNALKDVTKQISEDREQTKRRCNIVPWIVVAFIAIVFAVLQVIAQNNYQKMHKETLDYFSQYEFYTEETTVTQDTAEGGGNNNYFAGEATYNEGEEVDGEANS